MKKGVDRNKQNQLLLAVSSKEVNSGLICGQFLNFQSMVEKAIQMEAQYAMQKKSGKINTMQKKVAYGPSSNSDIGVDPGDKFRQPRIMLAQQEKQDHN